MHTSDVSDFSLAIMSMTRFSTIHPKLLPEHNKMNSEYFEYTLPPFPPKFVLMSYT